MAKKVAAEDRRSPRRTRAARIAELVAELLGIPVEELEELKLSRSVEEIVEPGDTKYLYPWVLDVSFSRR